MDSSRLNSQLGSRWAKPRPKAPDPGGKLVETPPACLALGLEDMPDLPAHLPVETRLPEASGPEESFRQFLGPGGVAAVLEAVERDPGLALGRPGSSGLQGVGAIGSEQGSSANG